MKWPSFTRGDAAIGLSVALLLWALLAPALRARSFRLLAESAVSDVEALRDAAASSRETLGRWPAPSPRGIAPPALSGTFPGDSALVRDGYALEWSGLATIRWVEVELPPVATAPGDDPPDSATVELRPIVGDAGVVVVHSSRDDLLAALLLRFGPDASYVRDSTWTLVVPDADDGTP